MINCNEVTKSRIDSAKAGDPSILVSLEVLDNLPDIYSANVTSVEFKVPLGDNSNEDWSVVSKNPTTYMPTVNLLSRMADARGINGLENGSVKQLVQMIDWNRITLDYDNPPKLVNYPVGYEATKMGSVLLEDGTERISDPAIVIYNVFERCNELWSKEEKETEFYTKCQVATNGTKTYTAYSKTQYCKYDTKARRMAHLAGEMKFAETKANMKARNIVIRTLCSMQTGYSYDQIKNGYFIVGKIVKSNFAVKSEHTARLTAMAHGNGDNTASASLFKPATPMIEDTDMVDVTEPAFEVVPDDPVTDVINRDVMIKALSKYTEFNLVPADKAQVVANLIGWLNNNPTAETTGGVWWTKALSVLSDIESGIKPDMIVR